jgi:hypothetical protein
MITDFKIPDFDYNKYLATDRLITESTYHSYHSVNIQAFNNSSNYFKEKNNNVWCAMNLRGEGFFNENDKNVYFLVEIPKNSLFNPDENRFKDKKDILLYWIYEIKAMTNYTMELLDDTNENYYIVKFEQKNFKTQRDQFLAFQLLRHCMSGHNIDVFYYYYWYVNYNLHLIHGISKFALLTMMYYLKDDAYPHFYLNKNTSVFNENEYNTLTNLNNNNFHFFNYVGDSLIIIYDNLEQVFELHNNHQFHFKQLFNSYYINDLKKDFQNIYKMKGINATKNEIIKLIKNYDLSEVYNKLYYKNLITVNEISKTNEEKHIVEAVAVSF